MKLKNFCKVSASLALAAALAVGSVSPAYAAPANKNKTNTVAVKKPTVKKNSALYKALTKNNLFDYEYYKQNNPDVVKALGSSYSALLNHFLTYGIYEGRQPNVDFNVNAYSSAYGDLQAAFEGKGNDYQVILNYYNHYVNYGIKEKREITSIEEASAAGITVRKVGNRSEVLNAATPAPAPASTPAPAATPAPAPSAGGTHSHNYSKTKTASSCLWAEYTYKCDCGDSYVEKEEWEDDTIDYWTKEIDYWSRYHHYDSVEFAESTCLAPGYCKYACTVCGRAPFGEDYIHYFENETYNPIKYCTFSGYVLNRNSDMSKTYLGEYYPNKEENPYFSFGIYGDVITPATCTEGLVGTATCTTCGKTMEFVGEPLGHFMGSTVKHDPNCTQDGDITRSCTRCDYKETETIPALGHYAAVGSAGANGVVVSGHSCARPGCTTELYVSADTYPTCTEDGKGHFTCADCNQLIEDVRIPAKGHSYDRDNGWVSKEPTAEEDGEMSYRCFDCEDVITEVIPGN